MAAEISVDKNTTTVAELCGRLAVLALPAGSASDRRDCHFADTPSPALLKRLLKVEGGCSRMTVSPTARLDWRPAGGVGLQAVWLPAA